MMKLKLDYHLTIILREIHYPIHWQKCICIQKFGCNPINEFCFLCQNEKFFQKNKKNNLTAIERDAIYLMKVSNVFFWFI